jgi:hypothetical protein
VGTSALLIRGQAPLMHFNHDSIPVLFSDWGPGVRASRSENTRFEGKCHSLSVTRERVSWKNVGSLTHEGLASFFGHRFILPGFSSNIKVTERR